MHTPARFITLFVVVIGLCGCGDAPTPPAEGVVGVGGTVSSTNYRATVSVGTPVGTARSSNHSVRLKSGAPN